MTSIFTGFTVENADGDRFTVEEIVIANDVVSGGTKEFAIMRSLDGTPAFMETAVLKYQAGRTLTVV